MPRPLWGLAMTNVVDGLRPGSVFLCHCEGRRPVAIRPPTMSLRGAKRRGPQGSAACGGVKRPQRLGRHLPLHKRSAGQRLSANPEIRSFGSRSSSELPAWGTDCHGPDGPRNDTPGRCRPTIPIVAKRHLNSSFFIFNSSFFILRFPHYTSSLYFCQTRCNFPRHPV